jgi:hypothetical protein
MYSRTKNENGSYDTRCLYCFMTIASSVQTDEELDRLEARHICPEKALAELMAEQSSSAAKSTLN